MKKIILLVCLAVATGDVFAQQRRDRPRRDGGRIVVPPGHQPPPGQGARPRPRPFPGQPSVPRPRPPVVDVNPTWPVPRFSRRPPREHYEEYRGWRIQRRYHRDWIDYVNQLVMGNWYIGRDRVRPNVHLVGHTYLTDNHYDERAHTGIGIASHNFYREIKLKVLGDSAYLDGVTIYFCDRRTPTSMHINLGGQFYFEGESTNWYSIHHSGRCIQSFSVWGEGDFRDYDDTIVVLIGNQ